MTNSYVEVYLISQSGRLLVDPWKAMIGIEKEISQKEKESIKKLAKNEFKKIPQITQEVINEKLKIA